MSDLEEKKKALREVATALHSDDHADRAASCKTPLDVYLIAKELEAINFELKTKNSEPLYATLTPSSCTFLKSCRGPCVAGSRKASPRQ